jgi:hypothetical protein
METITDEARELVAEVRAAAREHGKAWEELVPTSLVINFESEAAEEAAYQTMAAAKRRLREHICRVYGVSARELASLATA